MSGIYGVSAFGLKDCAALPEKGCHLGGFFLADAVLPKGPLGAIRTGDEAEQERIHSGLSWPPEARVEPGKPLRRVPIPLAWSLLVDAGDQPARWMAEGGVSISIASIIAAHIKGVLNNNDCHFNNDDRAVVTIPDHLDEYGQEALLRALGNEGQRFLLLWRPVAAAMAWLEEVRLMDVAPADWMLVVYLGPDAIEFTPFGLRSVTQGRRDFVLPVRNRPRLAPGPSGAEWACALAEKADPLCAEDPGAFWQVFTKFPEIWAAISQTGWDMGSLPQPWSTRQRWRLWNPPPSIQDAAWNCPMSPPRMLNSLVRGSCVLENQRRRSSAVNWSLHLESELAAVVKEQKGRLRGITICGPLATAEAPPWLRREIIALPFTSEPRADSIWTTTSCDDPVATGARLFGQRLQACLPTYLDTLPGLTLYTKKGWKYEWEDVVEAKECDGGQDFIKSIEGKFFLEKETDKLLIYLRREIPGAKKPTKPVTSLSDKLTLIIQQRVECLGSVDEVDQCGAWDLNERFRKYALDYARWYYSNGENPQSPYRFGQVHFPSAPEKDEPLTAELTMRPASGLAKLAFHTRNRALFRGRSISFDYSRMKVIQEIELPEPPLGWPEDLHYEASTDPTAFQDLRFDDFIRGNYPQSKYIQRLDGVKDALTAMVSQRINGVLINLKKIDENGRSGSTAGNKTIAAIKRQVEIGAPHYLQTPPSEETRVFLVRSTWLWGATPEIVCAYLEKYLLEDSSCLYGRLRNNLVEASSRAFTSIERQFVLFDMILKYSTKKTLISSDMRSIARVLNYRKDGWKALTDEIAYRFADCAIQAVYEQVEKRNIKVNFFLGTLLFLALLKHRRSNQKFMDANTNDGQTRFALMQTCLDLALKITKNDNNAHQISILIQGVKDFMEYKGKTGVIGGVAEAAGEK